MKIAHYTHALWGLNNGLDRYLYNFISIFSEHENIIIVPEAENKIKGSEYCKTININSLCEIENIFSKENIDFLIIHYTGPEAIKEKNSIIKKGNKLISINPEKSIIDLCLNIDTHPFGYLFISQIKNTYKNLKVILITHSEYKLPNNIDNNFIDFFIHVSYKTFFQNKAIKGRHFVIYPCFLPQKKEIKTKNQIIKNSDKKIKVGWLGRLDKFDLEVYERLKRYFRNSKKYNFYFAGEGKLEINPKDIPENFYFLGNQDKDIFLSSIDIFLYPTTIDSFSLSLLEAAGHGLLILCSDIVEELAKQLHKNIEIISNECTYHDFAIYSLSNYLEEGYIKINKELKKAKSELKKYKKEIKNNAKKFNSTVFKKNFESIFKKGI